MIVVELEVAWAANYFTVWSEHLDKVRRGFFYHAAFNAKSCLQKKPPMLPVILST